MTVTNAQSGTNVNEVADGIYRINTPVAIDGTDGFSFNQYLIVVTSRCSSIPVRAGCSRWYARRWRA
jgi:hypothetical protein